MSIPGLTATGFVATTVAEEIADLNAKFLAKVEGTLDVAPDQPIGQVIGIFAEKFAELMELGATVYNAINPNAAEGQLLANVAAISGTFPQVATYSTVVGGLQLAAFTTVTAGAVASVAGQPTNTWVLLHDAVNSTGGPLEVFATFRSNLAGPFVANAGTLTVINTPTIGWSTITNPADAVLGLAADTDTTLRQRRQIEVNGEGSGDVDAIRAGILRLGVIQAFVFENTSLLTDADGIPGKAFHAIVWDGISPTVTADQIAQAIWKEKPSGIQAFGSVVGNATDSQGAPHFVYFDWATQVRIWVSCTTTPSTLTTAQTAAVKAAIAAYARATFNLGTEIVDLPFRASALLPGLIIDVPTFAFDVHSTPTNTANMVIAGTSIATVDTADILVNGV